MTQSLKELERRRDAPGGDFLCPSDIPEVLVSFHLAYVPISPMGQKAGRVFNLEGTRCYIDGVKHTVLMDDGRSVLVDCTAPKLRVPMKAACRAWEYHKIGTKKWVSRQTVDPHFSETDVERSGPPYFWLGAQAELKEMG